MRSTDKGATKGLIITVSGPHGSGKSTHAKALASALQLRYVSAGKLFRELANERKMSLETFSNLAAEDPTMDRMIDDRTIDEAKKGSVVIDAQLGAWILKDLADVKLLIVAPDEVRFRRIAQRDGISTSSAKKETIARESIQKHRYRKYYKIEVDDLSIYDLTIDTSQYPIEKTKSIIIEAVQNLLAEKRKSGTPPQP